ncbi:MAG: adenine deaminase [Methanomicrobiales archaeon]|nr:adenine deaminase [Methanomicrobiales archaeon]
MRRRSIAAPTIGGGPPDLAVHNCNLFNPFTCSWEEASFAIRGGHICSVGHVSAKRTLDLRGARVTPGFIDAHVHIESSLLTPVEFSRLVLRRGTTTVVADPHEIANVLGVEGLEYMLKEGRRAPLDILFMLPSSVPASPEDLGGAVLGARDLMRFRRRRGVIGLGEVMDSASLFRGDRDLLEKIGLFEIVDGHAPLMSGEDLDAYIGAGIQSDHESTSAEEAAEKLAKGMFIFAREGTAEKNLGELIPLIHACAISRWCFATDDRTAKMLHLEGSVDDCIRKAISFGCEPELALRMATLSPAERFGLHDRGAITPGRLADFCVLGDGEEIRPVRVFRRGREITGIASVRPRIVVHKIDTTIPSLHDLCIVGHGPAHVIGLVRGQIVTDHLVLDVDGEDLPDPDADILKSVVCNRYKENRFGIGLVRGFGLAGGAIASSVSHDAHHIVAVGADDRSIRSAISEVVKANGGMAVANSSGVHILPLECAGLMSGRTSEELIPLLQELEEEVSRLNGIQDAFMYLSFLALSVIPRLRITDAGPFEVLSRRHLPLFLGAER